MVAKKKTTKKVAKKAPAKKTVAKKSVAKKAVVKKAAAPAKVAGGWWGNSFSPAGVLVAMAAVMGILSMFVGWIGDKISGIMIGWNGWQLLTVGGHEKEIFLNNSWQIVIPVLVFVLAIIAFLAIILPAFKIKTNKVAIDVIVVVAGLVMFILAICFLFGEFGNGNEDFVLYGKFIDHLLPGFYMALVSSIVLILAGLADAIRNAKA